MTAVVVIAIAVLVGVGLVVSQLARLRRWLGKPPPDEPSDGAEG